jgi:hypothetical protein
MCKAYNANSYMATLVLPREPLLPQACFWPERKERQEDPLKEIGRIHEAARVFEINGPLSPF